MADLSSYVLVLRDLGEEGERGYALQLAPLQGGGARPTPTPPSRGSAGAATGAATAAVASPAPEADGDEEGGESGDQDIQEEEEQEETAAAAERIIGQIRTFLHSRGRVITHKEKVLIPIFYAPKKKDDLWNKRQVKYVVALLGPLGFMFAATPYLPRAVLLVFTALWGAGSVGLPMGLYGSDEYEKFFGRHMSRLILMAFSLMVVYAMYLSMIPVNTTTPALPSPSASDVPPATPPGQRASDVGMFWTASYCVVAGLIMAGHIYSWVMGFRTGSDEDEDHSKFTEKGLSTSDLLQRLLDSH